MKNWPAVLLLVLFQRGSCAEQDHSAQDALLGSKTLEEVHAKTRPDHFNTALPNGTGRLCDLLGVKPFSFDHAA